MDYKLIIGLLASLFVSLASLLGATVSQDAIYTVAAAVILVTVIGWNWWKNHDITEAAKTGSLVMNALKDGTITEDEVTAIFLDADKGEND